MHLLQVLNYMDSCSDNIYIYIYIYVYIYIFIFTHCRVLPRLPCHPIALLF